MTRAVRWRLLDPVDRAWSGNEYVRVFVDLDVPSADRLAAAVAALAVDAPSLACWLDVTTAQWRPVTAGELAGWAAEVVRPDPLRIIGPAHAVCRNSAALHHLPFRLVVGSDWVSLRISHAVADGWSANRLVAHLLRRAAAGTAVPVPWTTLPGPARDLRTARSVLRHRGGLLPAVRDRAALAGGDHRPGHDALPDPVVVFPGVPAGSLRELTALRDGCFPGVSVALVAYSTVRAALARALPAVRPGFECLFDVRAATGARDAFGNWAAGVYLRPADDLDPFRIAAAVRQARERGLPELAAAALRAKTWRRSALPVRTAAPEGAARLTFSWTGAHAMTDLPGVRPGRTVVGSRLVPNGPDAVAIEMHAVGDDLSVSVSMYDAAWKPALVATAIEVALARPASRLAPAAASTGGTAPGPAHGTVAA